MEKKQNKKSEMFLLRLPKEQKEKIFKVVEKSSYNSASELIRAGIEKELNLQMYKDNMDIITKELSNLIDLKLDNFLNSQRKLIANNTRASALNTYIMGEVMKRIMGDELYKEFLKILESGRAKSNYFVSRNAQDISKEELLDFYGTKIVRNILKDKEVKNIVDLLIDLKKELQKVDGSIKYQYLMKCPDIIEKVDNISNTIINSSLQCQKEIDKYIKAKQKLLEFQYSNIYRLEEMKEQTKQEAEKEIIKLIGNQILDIERKWLNSNETYTYIKYNNESRNLLDNILTALYYQAEEQKRYNRSFELKFKKQLSKQAKKELALKKINSSSWNWEDEI